MRSMRRLLSAVLVLAVGAVTAPVSADQLELVGTLRDFPQSHSDFGLDFNGKLSLIPGMVAPQLGADENPVFSVDSSVTNADDPLDKAIITVTFGNTLIHAESTQDLSNVVLELSDGTEYKYDELDTQGVTTEHTFAVPAEHAGTSIVGAWVKSGANDSGAGSGYGEYFSEPAWSVDSSWHVDSPVTFNQWFENVEGVNRSVPVTIVLDNGQNVPGGAYGYQQSKTFYPADGQLFGNEGDSHNHGFTLEIPARFEYTDPATRSDPLELHISADDDTWVFIDGTLVIDLGGPHAENYGSVNVDSIAGVLGLVPGESYDVHIFTTDRHNKTDSSLTIETTIRLLPALYD